MGLRVLGLAVILDQSFRLGHVGRLSDMQHNHEPGELELRDDLQYVEALQRLGTSLLDAMPQDRKDRVEHVATPRISMS